MPRKMICAPSMGPATPSGSRHRDSSSVHGTSATDPHCLQTKWWWKDVAASYRVAPGQASARITKPTSARSSSTLKTVARDTEISSATTSKALRLGARLGRNAPAETPDPPYPRLRRRYFPPQGGTDLSPYSRLRRYFPPTGGLTCLPTPGSGGGTFPPALPGGLTKKKAPPRGEALSASSSVRLVV